MEFGSAGSPLQFGQRLNFGVFFKGREGLKKSLKLQTLSEVLRPPPYGNFRHILNFLNCIF